MRTFTGRFFGVDAKDGSPQHLDILCKPTGLCDVVLHDPSFATCGEPFRGVATKTNVPVESLGNFSLPLFCTSDPTGEIDLTAKPSHYIPGSMILLSDSTIRRSGTGFIYYRFSPIPSYLGSTAENQPFAHGDINGVYSGIDLGDGSEQAVNIFCDDKTNLCDIGLFDGSFSTCKALNGLEFFGGVAVANGVPRNSLNDFNISLYCLQDGELKVDINDPNRAADAQLIGDLTYVADGILSRPEKDSTNYTFYNKITNKAKNGMGDPRKDIAMKFVGLDKEDGSYQVLTLLCKSGFCDITLQDTNFNTCIEFTSDEIFLGGLAIARRVPQESLDNFQLELYCVKDAAQILSGIDYTSGPSATLDGSLAFIGDSIVTRTGKNFTYFNMFKENNKKSDLFIGRFQGASNFDGVEKMVQTFCFDDNSCEITFYTPIFTRCILYSGKPYFNGVGRAFIHKSDFNDVIPVPIYCIPPPFKTTIDLNTATPAYYENLTLTPEQPGGLYSDWFTNETYWEVSY